MALVGIPNRMLMARMLALTSLVVVVETPRAVVGVDVLTQLHSRGDSYLGLG